MRRRIGIPYVVVLAGGAGIVGIGCGNVAGYACCVNESTGAQDCLPTSATCSGGFMVTCDGPEDCGAGQQCCMPSGAVSQTNCLGECLTGLAMCHRDSNCPQGQACCPTISFGYSHSNCVLGTSCS